MTRMGIRLLLLALAGALLAGCITDRAADTDAEPELPAEGGRVDHSDPNAPKTFQSNQIIVFDCWFSTETAAEPGVMGNDAYQFKAKLENGAVKASYQVRDTGAERSFRESHSFMNDIYEMVERYEIAQLNGHSVEVSGLPDNFGVDLDIQFASGEHLRVYDNQECLLPYNFENELLKLFERGAAVTPTVLDFRVESVFEHREVDGGWAEVSCPSYALGYLGPDGEEVLPNGYDALKAAIEGIDDELQSDMYTVWECFGKASMERMLYCRTEAFVTRADSEAVSFYQRTSRCEDAEQEHAYTEIVTHNLDARTGKELKFSDVFRDMEYLPHLLLMEFENTYPEQSFNDGALDNIRRSVESDDGDISFALGYGCVHVFADEYILNDEPGGQHITLSYILNPDQVRAFYTTAPRRWMIPLDDGTTYWRDDTGNSFRIRSTFGGLNQEDVIWEVMLDGKDEGAYAEPLYGSAPDCWLICSNERYFLYQNVPTGDVSMLTSVFEISRTGVSKRAFEPLGVAMRSDTTLDPDRMLMSINEPIFTSAVQMLPYAAFRVDEDGLPEMVSGVCDLAGPWVALREGGRYNPDSRDSAVVSGGMWTLIAGQELRPYRTDMESFLDFITDDGRIVRFAIDRFDDTMQLDNFGTLDDVFMPVGNTD